MITTLSFRNYLHLLTVVLLLFPAIAFSQGSKTYTLIVGMQKINDGAYQSKYDRRYSASATKGVVDDVACMQQIAEQNGHDITTLMNEKATVERIVAEIQRIGKKVKAGDQFIFYFSGHGDQIPDKNGDEASKYDQVLVAYNDFVVDDTIYYLLKKFFTTTNNIMIVDACHSSTSFKIAHLFMDFRKTNKAKFAFANEIATLKQKTFFFTADPTSEPIINEPFSLIYFGATEDNNVARGDVTGGLLTFWLNRIVRNARGASTWNNYTYARLAQELSLKMESDRQNLQFHKIGKNVTNYINQVPFKNY